MACCAARAPQDRQSPRPVPDDGGRGIASPLFWAMTALCLDDAQQSWNSFVVSHDRSRAESTLQVCHVRFDA